MKLRLLEAPPPWQHPAVDTGDGRKRHRVYEPGDCWYASEGGGGGMLRGVWYAFADSASGDDGQHRLRLTIATEHLKEKVHPMIVVLPNGRLFCLHQATSRGFTGWQIQGELPEVTVSPSIDFGGPNGWHGNIVAGEMNAC